MRIDPREPAPASGELAARRPDPAPRGERHDEAPAPSVPRLPGAAEADPAETARPLQARPEVPGFPLQELSIRREDEIGKVVVQVIDSETREVVRQIPPEEWVRVLKRLTGAKGVLVDEAG
jgi:flagellar protein FlaG